MSARNDRRNSPERRSTLLDRRGGADVPEVRTPRERRRNRERRSGAERRWSVLSAEEQIRASLRLLTRVIESGTTPEEEQRSLEGVVLRLRFALDRLEEE